MLLGRLHRQTEHAMNNSSAGQSLTNLAICNGESDAICPSHVLRTSPNTETTDNMNMDGTPPSPDHTSHRSIPNAFDVLGDRRKRRKVSPEPGELVEPLNNGTQLTQVKADIPANSKAPGDEVIELAKPADQSISISSLTRRKGRPRKSTADLHDTPHPVTVVGMEGERNGAGETPAEKSVLPVNQTAWTHGNGLLASKPASIATPTQCLQASSRNSRVRQKNHVSLKNGRLTRTLVVTIKYGHGLSDKRVTVGNHIDVLLSQPLQPNPTVVSGPASLRHGGLGVLPSKNTHPFFLGMTKATKGTESGISGPSSTDIPQQTEVRKPVAWGDIVFTTKKAGQLKDFQLQKPVWPPRPFQHIGIESERKVPEVLNMRATRKNKSKAAEASISQKDNILDMFTTQCINASSTEVPVSIPTMARLSCNEVSRWLLVNGDKSGQHPALSSVVEKLKNHSSPFDRAEAPGPLPWTQKHAPNGWEEVLQPVCKVLHDWLRSLAVHNVKQGLEPSQPKMNPRKKKRLKKHATELDDFIVDDQEDEPQKIRNSILIVGPHGCGKTASVYAVAKQLQFEVFEIHSGMRRGQKDIFDKVGDMAQNHMVQRIPGLSRDSSVLDDPDLSGVESDSFQPSVVDLLGGGKRKTPVQESRIGTPQPPKEQKQSLILFEEVDHIFEDDRGFWTGVQSLIQNSKRPVVLTCNSLHDIPLEELDLHTILTYDAPPASTVAEYLTCVAAAEGHLLQMGALQHLYRSKRFDLRATMTELDFWCQMTLGSTKGGLDWYPECHGRDQIDLPRDLRTLSSGTYSDGLDLLPVQGLEFVDQLSFLEACVGLAPNDVVDHFPLPTESVADLAAHFDARSVADLDSDLARNMILDNIAMQRGSHDASVSRIQVLSSKINKHSDTISGDQFSYCIRPLEEERPVFPPASGRLAPTLDAPRSVLVSDVLPFVRSIAAFDERLEQHRDSLFSSQGKKARATRAARAAAEGGDKATTRRERWFPASLDLEAVRHTGGDWPQWMPFSDEVTNPSPASTV